MAGFPEPLNIGSNKIDKHNANIEKKINSLEIKIMSLENTIMKLIKKIENTNSPKKTKKNRSSSKNNSRINSKTLKNIITQLRKGPYKEMKDISYK